MKRIIILLLASSTWLVSNSQTITDTLHLRQAINLYIQANAQNQINAAQLNRILNGVVNVLPSVGGSGGSFGVSTWKGRFGTVVPVSGDYSIGMITGALDSIRKRVDSIWIVGTTLYVKKHDVILSQKLSPFYTPYDFNGKGDGTTNDHDAIQSCVNTKACFIPEAKWRTNTSIDIPDSAFVYGNGAKSIITTSNDINVFSSVNKTNVNIKDLTFIKTGGIGSSIGLFLNGATFNSTYFDNLNFYGFNKGFFCTGNYLTHYTLRLNSCVSRGCDKGFSNDAYGEYTIYTGCIAEGNRIGWYDISGNNVWLGGSLSENSYIGPCIKYGDNGGHGGLIGALVNHNGNYALLMDSVPVSFTISHCQFFGGDTVYIKNSVNVKLDGNTFSRQTAFLVGGSTNIELNNTTFVVPPVYLNTNYLLPSTVKWFNPNFTDNPNNPPVINTISGALKTTGGLLIASKYDSAYNGVNLTLNNGGLDTSWIGARIRLKNITGYGADLAFATHPSNSHNDTVATDKFIIGEDGSLYAPKLYTQSGSTSDSVFVKKNDGRGTIGLKAQSDFGTVKTVSVTTANGVSGSVLSPTTTPAITLTLGAITPSSINVSGPITATTLGGTISTAAQPNITSLGQLSSLSVSGIIQGGTFSGTLGAGTLNSITSVGTLNSLTVTNNISAATLSATITTAAQPNITSLGTINGLNATTTTGYAVHGSASSNGGSGVYAEANGSSGYALVALQHGAGVIASFQNSSGVQSYIDNSGNYVGNASTATTAGTVTTAAQPNITSLGTLTALSVAGVVSVRSGNEVRLYNSGNTTYTTISNDGSNFLATQSQSVSGQVQPSLNGTYDIGTSSLKWRDGYFTGNVAGTLTTAAQPNITSVGTLTGLTVTSGITISGLSPTVLNNYSEGTFTPMDASGAGLSLSVLGYYQLSGNYVTCILTVTYPTTADASGAKIGGLPFTTVTPSGTFVGTVGYTDYNGTVYPIRDAYNKTFVLYNSSGAITNATLSGKTIRMHIYYKIN